MADMISRQTPDGSIVQVLGDPPAEPVLVILSKPGSTYVVLPHADGRRRLRAVLLAEDRKWLREQLARFDGAGRPEVFSGSPVSLDPTQLLSACSNIGYDLGCRKCSFLFYTGTSPGNHDPGCSTRVLGEPPPAAHQFFDFDVDNPLFLDRPVPLTGAQLVRAAENAGVDLRCERCARIFFTSVRRGDHSPECRSLRREIL